MKRNFSGISKLFSRFAVIGLLLVLVSFSGVKAQDIYAINNGGDWDDGSTWSLSSGGATCNCEPNANSTVHIGERSGVTMKVIIRDDKQAKDVIIYADGELEWTRSYDLYINNGGKIDVKAGGVMDRNGRRSEIRFNDGTDCDIIVDGDLSIFKIQYNASGTHTISGSGTIFIRDDLEIQSDANITSSHSNFTINDLLEFRQPNAVFTNTGTINVNDDIRFDNNGCSIINNGTISVTDDIYGGNGDDDNTITNNATGTITVGDLLNINSSDRFIVSNNGTFNLGGDIRNSPGGANAVKWYNYAGATANFADNDVDHDDRLLLYANYDANTINYNGNLNQDIATPQDAYWHLTLSGTGIKETQANLTINGNVTIEGAAALNPDTNNDDLTIGGNWTNTSTNADAFRQGTETVTFSGSNAQTITNASGEVFYDLVFDNSAGFVVNGDIGVTGSLTMTDGNIDMGSDRLTLGDAVTNVGIFNYTSGTVIGAFERWVANGSTETLAFPVGTSTNTNTGTIDLGPGTSGGSLIVEFIASDPGSAGLPLTDDLSTVSEAFSDGYWSFTVANGFSVGTFDLTLDGSGMSSNSIDQYTRILTRANAGSDWSVEGTHLAASDPLVYRAGMSSLPAEFGLGVSSAPPAPTIWYSHGGGGNWSTATTWTQDGSGLSLVPATGGVPASNDYVVILSGATVVMDADNITVASLELVGNLQVGTTSGHDFTTISGNGKMFLEGSGGMDNFPDGVTALFSDASIGGTVEYNGTGTLTLGTQREFNNFILNLDNTSDEVVLLNDMIINGNFTLTQGDFQINDNSSSTVLNLTVYGSALVNTNATMSVGQGNTIGSYTIQGGMMPGTGNYHSIFHQVKFGGDFTNNGSVRFTNQTAPVYDEFTSTGAATVQFFGAANNTVSLFGTTDFYNLIIDKGNDQTYELEINSDNVANFALYGPNSCGRVSGSPFSAANPEVRKALWIYNGTLHFTGQISIPTLTEGAQNGGNGDYPIGQNAALWLDGVNVTVYSTADDISQIPSGASGINKSGGSGHQALSLYGTFRITNGFFGTRASGGFIFWNDAAGNVIVEGGTVNVSQFRSASGGTGTNSYIQSGGTVIVRSNVGQSGEVDTGFALFSMHLQDAVFNMSGGTLQVYGEREGGHGSVFINSGEGYYSVTGGDLIVENRNNINARIASTVPFWNLTLDKNGGSASQIELITNMIHGETILDPDLIVLNNFTIKNGVTFDHNGNDVEIGSDFVIENGADYLYNAGMQNTTTINGVDNSLMAFYNRTGGTSDEQQFWNLIIDKPSGKTVTLLSGKTGTNREGNANNLLRINGDAFKLLSGTLDQAHYSIRVYTDTLLNYDDLTIYQPTGATTDANSNSDNDLIKFRPDPFVLITADTSKFGNVRLNNGSNIVTLVSDVYMERMEYRHGRIDLKNQNLKIDKLFINLNGSEADWNSCGGCNSVEDMLILDGNTSDGGLSLYVNADQTLTFPIGIGTDALDADVDTGSGTGNSKYTPAQVTISNYSDDGYITIRTVDDQLATTNPSGDILSYYWRVDYSDFSTLPTVTYQFTYYDDDVDGGNEAGYVPGKVLDDTPFTRSSEIASNINTSTNSITFNGNTGSGASPFTLESANYTAGAPARFTGNVEVYYTRVLGDAAVTNWRAATNWTLAPNGSLEPHDSRQPAATDYPKAGDIAYVGWVPYGDPAYDDGKPHGIEINGTETFAELRFTQMLDMSDNPTARNYEYNFQFRPTVCINPSGAMNANAVKGEGAFWMRSTGPDQVDPDFSSVDMGAFALEDSAYMIYESTNSSFVYTNIPSEVPNLMIAGNDWGGRDRDFEISSDVTVKEDFELLGDVNLVLSSGGSGDFYVEGDLRIIRLNINNNDSQGGGEIAFPNDASRTIEVLGDLELVNQNALVNIRGANAPVQVSNLIVHGNIIQNNTSGGGLQLSPLAAGSDYVHLTLRGEGTHSFEQTSGADASLYSVTVNKGTDQSSSFSFNGNFTLDGPTSGVGVDKALTLENGIAVINNSSINIDLSTGDDDFNIPASAGLQVTDGQVNVSGNDSGIFLDGSLIIDGGTVDMDDGSGNGNNYIEYSSSGSARIDISSGTLVVGSQVRGNLITPSSVLDYTQTGGTVVVGKNAAPEASRSVFEVLNTGSNFTYTGGSLTLVRQNTAAPSAAALRILPTFSDVTQTIVLGNSDTPAGQTSFGINANVPLAGLTITGGPNHPTGVIQVNPLNLTNTLTIDAGAELDGNALELILEGDFVNNGTYTPSANKTTFSGSSAQSISGTGTIAFYDFNKTGTGTLNSSVAFTINNDLTISEGIFDDNGNTIDVLGNAEIDATHQSTGGAGDGLRFSGSVEQQLTRSSSGTGTIGMLTLQNSNGLVIPEGNGYNFNIDGGLKLNGGVFNIGSSAVTLGENAWISTTSAYSLTNMVKTNSSFTDNGLGKIFPAGHTGMFTYPIGEVKYTPVTVDFSVSGGTSGSTVGSIAVRPANEYHPTVDDGIQGMPSQPDKDNVLQYYWTLRANNLTGFTADVKFYYDQADVSVTQPTYSEADYIPAKILAFNNLTNLVNKYDVSDLDETNNIISFSAASVFNGVDENGVSGDYFAGIDEAIPDNVVTYTVNVDGGSVAGDSYNFDVPGGGAPSGAVVVIPNGYTLDFDINNVKLYKTDIRDGGVLEVNNDTKFHRLGIVEGIGTLKIVHDGGGNPALPAGDFGTFFSCSGGGLEYGGTGSYDILGGIPDIRNLTLSGSGDRNFPNANVTICEDLVVDGATVNVFNNRAFIIRNNALLLSGIVNAPAGNTARISILNNFTINGGIYNGSTSGNTGVVGDLIIDGGTFNAGSSNFLIYLYKDLVFNSGFFNSGSDNVKFIFYALPAFFAPTKSEVRGDFTGLNAFHRIEINKNSTNMTLELNSDIEIQKSLLLSDGVINTNGNKITLGSSTTVTPESGSSNSYINGRVVKTLSNAGDDFTFPIGSTDRWRPATVKDVSAGGLAWEAEYFDASAINEASVTNLSPADPSILTMSSQEYWKVSDGNAGPSGVTATVGLNWGSESDVSSAMAEREQLEVMAWNGTNWDNFGGANFSSGHSQSQGSFNSSSSVSFSEKIITLGSTDLSNPLPVELVSFTGIEQNGIVKLAWETASELNNDYFMIEHSTDGSNFVEIGKVEGAGTTQEKQTYSFLHRRPVYPNNYYRLKQVDFDGAFEYSDIIVVRLNKVLSEVQELDFVLYPNPTRGNSVNVHLNSVDHAQPLVIEVINLNGTRIFTKRYDSIDLYGDIELSFGYGATRGVYIVKLIQESGTAFRRLMLK